MSATEPKPPLLPEPWRTEIKELVREVISEHLANVAKDDALMDVEDVARFLKQSPDWVYRHWKQLGGRKIGAKSIRFYRSDIDHCLKS
jgi:hypothetical protein